MSSSQQIRRVLVDDSDPSLDFDLIPDGPNWFTATSGFTEDLTNGQPYLQSQHGVKTRGALYFNYTGSRLWLIGTRMEYYNISGTASQRPPWVGSGSWRPPGAGYQRPPGVGTQKPPWSCSLDSETFEYVPGPGVENNRVLCDTGIVQDGPHNFSVALQEETGRFTLWVDQIWYIPSPSTSTTQTTRLTVIIDEADPAITYSSGVWQAIDGKLMLTKEVGATVNVQFNGTKVSWYGSVLGGYPPVNSTATVTIDSNTPYTITIPSLLPDAPPRHNESIFETDTLPEGLHSITVVYEGTDAPLTLDYLVVQDGDILAPLSSVADSAPPVTTSTTSTPPATPPPPGIRRIQTYAIVLIAVGCVVLLALAVALLVRRRRRREEAKRLMKTEEDGQLHPFHLKNDPDNMTAESSLTANLSLTVQHPAARHTAKRLTHVEQPSFQTNVQAVGKRARELAAAALSSIAARGEHTPSSSPDMNTSNESNDVSLPRGPRGDTTPARVGSDGMLSDRVIVELDTGEGEEGERIVVINRHEDSGIRIPEAEVGVEVVELPPIYSEQ